MRGRLSLINMTFVYILSLCLAEQKTGDCVPEERVIAGLSSALAQLEFRGQQGGPSSSLESMSESRSNFRRLVCDVCVMAPLWYRSVFVAPPELRLWCLLFRFCSSPVQIIQRALALVGHRLFVIHLCGICLGRPSCASICQGSDTVRMVVLVELHLSPLHIRPS